MAVYYVETSALIKRYRSEKGTEVVDEVFEGKAEYDVLTTSYFTVLEVSSVATRLQRGSIIHMGSYRRLLATFMRDVREVMVLQPVSEMVLSEAIDLIMTHALRAPDAVHLATALSIRASLSDVPLAFVASDARLKAACGASGLSVLDPEEPQAMDILGSFRSRS
ncbi:MAG: type II toxin-antitoxin system VapC family toxin [Dehalococcoidia bacterium]|nr:type II toxin-antitoxin system VapC family toxin [Dehalococcoidia bacterium]